MSQQDLHTVMDRSRTESNFATELFQDLTGTLQKYNYTLTPDELQQLHRGGGATPQVNASAGPFQPATMPTGQPTLTAEAIQSRQFQQKQESRLLMAQADRAVKLGDCVFEAIQTTINHAAGTYRRITLMNQVMFWMGVSLFLFAVGYAVFTHNLIFSIAFAGLGTASFIGVFILGPIGKTQAALSNLISAEIAFLSYLEQVWLIEQYARLPCNPMSPFPDPDRMARASELLQARSSETSDLLHRYLDKTMELQEKELKQRAKDTENAMKKAVTATV